MHLLIAEVPVAAPAIVEALPPLLLLTGLLIALGLIVVLDGFVKGILSALAAISSWIPLVGSITAGVIHKAEQAISGALGEAISRLERAVAHQWHNLARVLGHLWRTILSAAELIFALAVLAGASVTIPIWRHLIRPYAHRITAARHLATKALNEIHALEKEIGGTIPRHLVNRLQALEHAVADTLPRTIKTARDLAQEAEDGVARLWDRVKSIEGKLSDTAIAAAVATALAAIGLDWLACRSRSSVNGKAGCALWNDIEGLLATAIVDAALIASLYELIRVAQEVTPTVTGLASDLLDV